MKSEKPIALLRECEVILIPSGDKVRLRAGSRVWVTQSLGGHYTVMTEQGEMARIAGKDADALGLERVDLSRPAQISRAEGGEDLEKLVWEQLRTCFDPEIPVNIVELGLVYRCQVSSRPEGGNRVEIQFTLTAPGCGMGEWLKEDIKSKIVNLPGVEEVEVEIVWDPPWNQDMISKEAKIELGIL